MVSMLTPKRDEKKTSHAKSSGDSATASSFLRDTTVPSGLPRFLQAKLAVNQPDDAYEHEANHVADQVLKTPGVKVQRKCASCDAGGRPCPSCQSDE
jgi:hypothetical protein